MSLLRKELRDAVVAVLKSAETMAGDNVFSSRSKSIKNEHIPDILVETQEEVVEIFEESPRRLKRTVEVAVDCIIRGNENAEDTLDEMCEEVEQALLRSPMFDPPPDFTRAVAAAIRLRSVTLDHNPSGTDTLRRARLSFDADVYQEVPDATVQPDGILTDAHVEIDAAPPDGNPESIDDLEFPQT